MLADVNTQGIEVKFQFFSFIKDNKGTSENKIKYPRFV